MATSPLDYILQGARKILDKGEDAFRGDIGAVVGNQNLNATKTGIAINTALGLPKAAKDMLLPTRGYTEQQLKQAKPTTKDILLAIPKIGAEIASIGEVFGGARGLQQFASTDIGGKLADAGNKIRDFAKPKTAGQASAMRIVDILTLFPVGSLKVTATGSSTIAKTKNLSVIKGVLKKEIPDLADDALEAFGRVLVDVDKVDDVQRVINRTNLQLQKLQKATPVADNLTTNVKAIMETGKPLPRTPVLPSNLPPVASKVGSEANPLLQEAKKYKSAEEFVKAQKDKFVAEQGFEPSSMKVVDDWFQAKQTQPYIGVGGQNPEFFTNRPTLAEMPKGEISKYLEFTPEGKAIYYRGIDKNIKTRGIRWGDFLSPNKGKASFYGKVERYELDPKYVYQLGDMEAVYLNPADKLKAPKPVSLSQLTDIWNKANKAAMAKMEPPKIRQMKTSAEIPSLERTAEMQGVTPKPNEIKLPKQTQVGVEKVQQGYTNRQSQTPTIPLKSSSYKDNTTAMIERKRAFETPTTPLGIYGKLQQSLSPVKFLDEVSQKIYKDWSRTVEKAKVLGDKELSTFKIPTKDSWQSILDYQAGKKTALTGEIKNKFDSLFKEAGARGLDIGYNERYLPQVYKESANEIKDKIAQYLLKNGMSKEEILAYQNGKKLSGDIARRLKLNPFFSKEKVFPDYKTAMEYGLTPKYKDLNQLVAHYRKEMETTLANRNFIESLINTDKLLLVDDAPSNWKPVELPFSIKGYYADPRLAKVLNGLFGVEKGFLDTVFSVGASASRRAQEISLSAGIPYTSVNFFSIGQLIKEMTSGNFKAVIPFVRANFGEKSLEYFNKNRNYLEMMADEGLRLGDHVGTLGNTYKNLAGKKKFWEGLGVKFDKAFNEKTFAGFMPQLYTQTFKDIYLKGIKSGLGEKEARALAGETVKKAFGLIEDFGRSGKTEDKLSAIFFAPKFREGVVNTLKNTAKSGLEFGYKLGGTKAPLDPAFTKNRKLLAGMIITYGIYNAVNYVLNDNFMWDNPDNRKFALQIPRKGGELIYVEFMPSFLAFARNIISGGINLATGDVKGATQKLGSLLSMPVKTSTEVIANKDYFGNEIYKDEDSALVKAGKIAKYVGLAVNHPYIKEIINQIGDKKPLYQSIAMALELPVKFGSVQKVSKSKEFGGNLTLKDIQKSIKADVESGKIDIETAVESYIGQRQALIENRKKERLGMSLSEFKKSLASDIKEGLVTEDEGVEEYISYKQEEEQQAKREEQMKETYPDRNLVNLVIDYAKAYKTDPVMAWKAMVTREKLDKVAGDKVTLQRFFGKHYLDPTEGSEAYMKKELNKLGIAWSERENYNLEHIIPLTAGGDNSSNNLQIISRELHNTYTPVDTKAGKAVESGKLSRRQVARIMRQLKIDKTISVQQALNML